MNLKFYISIGAFTLFFVLLQSIRVKDTVYVNLYDTNFACFRILNGTHQVGCQSNQHGSHGVVHVIEDSNDVNFVVKDPGGQAPFIVAMRLATFKDMSLLYKLKESEKVSGILLFHQLNSTEAKGISYSEDSFCPNKINDLYEDNTEYACKPEKKSWNPSGSGIKFLNWDIPIFLLQNETEIGYVENECYRKFNEPTDGVVHDWPLCALEMTMFNLAAGNSVMCLRRNSLFSGLDGSGKTCEMLEDENIYAFIPKTNKSKTLKTDSVFVLAARMDSFSLFSQHDLGAVTALSNVITMLAVAQVIGKIKNETFIQTSDKHLMLVLFNGESLDYIGSSRMTWDISMDNFPDALKEDIVNQSALFNFSHIDFFLELNQLILDEDSEEFYLHVDPISTTDHKVKAKVEKNCKDLMDNSKGVINNQIDYANPLPPASLQMFLKYSKEIAGAVLTNHKDSYTNRFYNSFLDSEYHFNRTKAIEDIVRLSNSLIKFILQAVWGATTSVVVDDSFVNISAECFWHLPEWNCIALERIIDSIIDENMSNQMKKALNEVPLARTYPSVKFSRVRFFVVYMMSFLLGDRYDWTNKTAEDCNNASLSKDRDDIHEYLYSKDLFNPNSNESYCIISTVQTSVAKSPAFEINGYDMISGEYSTWTESVWNTPQMRMFMKPNPSWETGVFACGAVVMVTSLVTCYFLHKGSDALFATSFVAP